MNPTQKYEISMQPKLTNRYFELDFLRFTAAISVVLFHYFFRGSVQGHNLSNLNTDCCISVMKYGYLGVDLFFMVSGFVILMTAAKKNFREFVLSRFLRLYPAYWFCVSITAICTIWIGQDSFQITWVQYLVNLTMIQELFGVSNVDGVYWTLFVEIKFYLLIGIVVLLNQTRNIEYFLFAWLAITIIDRCFSAMPFAITFIFFTEWSPYFIAGATCYLIRTNQPTRSQYLLFFCSLAMALYNAHLRVPGYSAYLKEELSLHVALVLITGIFATMLLVAMNKLQSINRPEFVALGALTYPLYLLHQFVGYMIFNQWNANSNPYALIAVVIAGMLLLSYLIHLYIETPCVKFLRSKINTYTN